MKKIVIFAGMALGLGLASCVKDVKEQTQSSKTSNDGVLTLIATTSGGTRTTAVGDPADLSTGLSVNWAPSDQIKIYDGLNATIINAASGVSFNLMTGAGSKTATFSGNLPGGDTPTAKRVLMAIYPVGAITGASPSLGAFQAAFDIDTVQTQNGDNDPTFGRYLQMWADSIDLNNIAPSTLAPIQLHFYHVTAVIDIPITGVPASQTITKVRIVGVDNGNAYYAHLKTVSPTSGANAGIDSCTLGFADPFLSRCQVNRHSYGGNFVYGAVSGNTYYGNSTGVNLSGLTAGEGVTARVAIYPRDNMVDMPNVVNKPLTAGLTRDLDIVVTTVDASNNATVYTVHKHGVDTHKWVPGKRLTCKTDAADGGGTINLTAIANGDYGNVSSSSLPVTVAGTTIEVKDVAGLQWVAANMGDVATYGDGTNAGFAGHTVQLTDDINMNGVTWAPLGTATTPFRGNFDGNGRKISNLTVSGTVYASLLGKCAGSSASAPLEIKGLTLDAATITVPTSSAVTTNGSGGILANGTYVDISNCTVSNLTLSTNTGQPASMFSTAGGGIMGYADHCNITSCETSGTVTSTWTGNTPAAVGGICGFMTQSTIVNCSNSATISYAPNPLNTGQNGATCNLGGIVAAIDGTTAATGGASLVMGCTNSGAVSQLCTASGIGNWRVGGIAGLNGSLDGISAGATPLGLGGGLIVGCHNTGNIKNAFGNGANGGTGGIVGMNNGVVSACYHSTGTVAGGSSSPHAGFIAGNNNKTVEYCYYYATTTTDAGAASLAVAFPATAQTSDFALPVNVPDASLPGWGGTQPTGWTAAFEAAYPWATPWDLADPTNPAFK